MVDFLHGVETVDVPAGRAPVREVKSGIIGLVGTAPIHRIAEADQRLNVGELVRGDVTAAKYFGSPTSGYSIPQALQDIYSQGGGTVVVVNVFDPTVHKATVAAADLDIVDGVITLLHQDILTVVVKAAGGAGAALVEGTDYDIDLETGVITVIEGGALDAEVEANVGYDRADPAAVVAADIVGEVNEAGERTGMQAWLDSFSRWGFHPKILCAPGYSVSGTVVAAMEVLSAKNKLRATYLVDAPVGTTSAEALEARGPEGELNLDGSNVRGFATYPHLKAYDIATDELVLRAYSSTMAGIIARVDREQGYWVSPSNKPIRAMKGTEFPIQFAINDPDCEANALNGAGICTAVATYGGGLRTWGNRSMAFPGSNAIETFLQSQRTIDMIHESLELAALDYMDVGLSDVAVQAILASSNAFMRLLVTRRAIPPGSHVAFNPEKNPSTELEQGRGRFDLIFSPVPPLEHAIIESTVDTTLLANLFR